MGPKYEKCKNASTFFGRICLTKAGKAHCGALAHMPT
jgi:hypothetical protein